MDCDTLRDDQWERIKVFVPGGTARTADEQRRRLAWVGVNGGWISGQCGGVKAGH